MWFIQILFQMLLFYIMVLKNTEAWKINPVMLMSLTCYFTAVESCCVQPGCQTLHCSALLPWYCLKNSSLMLWACPWETEISCCLLSYYKWLKCNSELALLPARCHLMFGQRCQSGSSEQVFGLGNDAECPNVPFRRLVAALPPQGTLQTWF